MKTVLEGRASSIIQPLDMLLTFEEPAAKLTDCGIHLQTSPT